MQQHTEYRDSGYVESTRPALIADRYEAKPLAINLTILALLGAVVTFCVVWAVDLIVSQIMATPPAGTETALVWAAMSALIGIAVGLIYIPIAGTSNESLYAISIVALASVAGIAWVVMAGLFSGDFTTLVTFAGIVCTAGFALAAPARIDAAERG